MNAEIGEDILATALHWKQAGRDVALATVVTTWGSAPRPVGSQLAVDGEGKFIGSVSGGCIEGAVVTEALDAIRSEEHTSELQSLMRISYAGFCLKKKHQTNQD